MARCGECSTSFLWQDGYLDLVPELRLPTTAGLGPLLLQDPLQVIRYEDLTRPAFLRVAATNWQPALTPEDERQYLRTHADPADGPILDIACGAGRWTRVFADQFGYERIIGLDMSPAMLTAISRDLPGVLAVRASALRLPFMDDSLGAANCSAALQIMPDPKKVIQEIGRCIRPGGTFTLATLQPASRQLQRYFQHRQEEVFNTRSFDPKDILEWLDGANLTVIDHTTPAGFQLVTAEKRGAFASDTDRDASQLRELVP
ncbi:class I SAM-dependent methyltransferase [Mycolicibacterium sp. XJ870]